MIRRSPRSTWFGFFCSMIHRPAIRKTPPAHPGSAVHSQDTSLKELLHDLAAVLPLGITPKAFATISREAFVLAAARSAKLRNGKINQSRVSAQTGLARADIRRILSADNRRSITIQPKAPIELACIGWTSDRAFLDRSRRPKQLPINGRRSSFASLAKKYAPDVPHRALLRELERTGAVVVRDGKVRLTAPAAKKQRASALAEREPIQAIHRFTFGRGEADTDAGTGKSESERLLKLLKAFKHAQHDDGARAPQSMEPDVRALAIVTVVAAKVG
jgi:hypothetical protein